MAGKPTLTVRSAATPSEQIIEDANRICFVVDSLGRKIGFRRMSMMIRRMTLKIISAEMSAKEQYMQLVGVAACVVSIDGDPVSFPNTELQFDALIDRLDDAGWRAVMAGLIENFAVKGDGSEDGAAAEEIRQAKN